VAQGTDMGAVTRAARVEWWVFAILVLALLAWPMAFSPIFSGDTDLWYHLNAGRYIRDTGALPDHSFFSFIDPARPFTDYYWLSQVCFHAVHGWAGYAGLAVLRISLFGGFSLLAAAILRGGPGIRSTRGFLLAGALLILLLIVVQGRFANLRPHAFTYLIALAFLTILELRPGWVPALPVLAALWVNLHGITYPLLVTICLAYLAEIGVSAWRTGSIAGTDRRKALLLGLAMLAVWATPHLGRLLPVPFRLTPLAHEYIGELRRAPLAELADLRFENLVPSSPTAVALLAGLSILAVLLTLRRQRLRVAHLLLLAGGTVLLSQGVRFSSEFAILSLPLLASLSGREADPDGHAEPLIRRPLAAVLALPLASAAWNHQARPFPFPSASLPSGTAHFLRTAGEGGKVLHHPNGGGFLQWELHPRYRIFMDMEVPFLFRDEDMVLAIAAQENPAALNRLIVRYAPEYVLVSHWEPGFGALVAARQDYAAVFMDDASVLFAHRAGAAGVVGRHEFKALAPLGDPGRGFSGVVRDGNRAAAILELEVLISAWPEAGLARQWLAQARLEEGRAAEALALLDAIPPRAHTGASMFLRGQTLLALGRHQDSVQAFELSLHHPGGPDPRVLHRATALAKQSMGDQAGAYTAFSRAIHVMDSQTGAEDIFRYAASAIGTGRIEEGVQLLQVAELRLKPGEEVLRARILSALAAAGSAPIQGGPPVQSTEKSPYLSTQ